MMVVEDKRFSDRLFPMYGAQTPNAASPRSVLTLGEHEAEPPSRWDVWTVRNEAAAGGEPEAEPT